MYMIHAFLEAFLNCLVFDRFQEFNLNFIRDVIPRFEAMDSEAVTAKVTMSEFVKQAQGATPEVAEVLAKVPKSLRMPRLKMTSTKESAKDKKGKQVAIPMCIAQKKPIEG